MSLIDGTIIKNFGNILDDGISGIVITADEKFFFTSCGAGVLQQWNYEDRSLVRNYGEITDQIYCLCL